MIIEILYVELGVDVCFSLACSFLEIVWDWPIISPHRFVFISSTRNERYKGNESISPGFLLSKYSIFAGREGTVPYSAFELPKRSAATNTRPTPKRSKNRRQRELFYSFCLFYFLLSKKKNKFQINARCNFHFCCTELYVVSQIICSLKPSVWQMRNKNDDDTPTSEQD